MDTNLFYAQQKQLLNALDEFEESQEKRKRNKKKHGIIATLHKLVLRLWFAILGWTGSNADTGKALEHER